MLIKKYFVINYLNFDLACKMVTNNCLGKSIKLLNIFFGLKFFKSSNKYLDIAKADILLKLLLISEDFIWNLLGKVGSSIGFI